MLKTIVWIGMGILLLSITISCSQREQEPVFEGYLEGLLGSDGMALRLVTKEGKYDLEISDTTTRFENIEFVNNMPNMPIYHMYPGVNYRITGHVRAVPQTAYSQRKGIIVVSVMEYLPRNAQDHK
jgi:hypothetical protein